MATSNQIFPDISKEARNVDRVAITPGYDRLEMNGAIQAAAAAMRAATPPLTSGSVAVAACMFLAVSFAEEIGCKDFDKKLAVKLRRVADLLDHQKNVGSILEWFAQAVPVPTDKTRSVQIGVHYEEITEMMYALCEMPVLRDKMRELADMYKQHLGGADSTPVDHKELLDSLCDQIVTATGVGYMFGFDMDGALAEVNRSNWSKFVDGKAVFDANGKIAKGPGYFKPDLSKYVAKGDSQA